MTDTDFDAYTKIEAVNWSTLKEMRRSPLHYKHRLTTPREDTPSLALGRATHTAVFEPDRFALEYAVFKGERRAGKEWEAFKESHKGETILKLDEYMRCLAIRDAVRANPVAADYLAEGIAEQTIRWNDKETGIACKGRYDWYSRKKTTLVDLKTTKDIDQRRFAQTAARFGYHSQLAFYADGLSYHAGRDVDVVIIAVEYDAPYDVAVFHLDLDVLWAGREEYQELLRRVAGCRQLGRWPGKYTERQSLELPRWVFGDDDETADDLGLTTGGAHGLSRAV